MTFGQLQEKISKASLPVRADLSSDFESIIMETDPRKISPFMRLFWEEQQKYLQSSQNNATYHSTLILMLHIRQPIYLVLTNVLSSSFLMFHIHLIKLELHCLYNSGKPLLDIRYLWSNDMFIIWNCISAIFYEDRDCCLLILPKQRTFVH